MPFLYYILNIFQDVEEVANKLEETIVNMSQSHSVLCKDLGAWGVIFNSTGAPIVSLNSKDTANFSTAVLVRLTCSFPDFLSFSFEKENSFI